MGVFEFLIATVPVVLFFSVPLYAINLRHKQKSQKLDIMKIQEEKELEQLRQENFIIENKQMQLELDRMKEERERQRLEDGRDSRWLIQDTEDRMADKKPS
ncbi:hypothetical protein J4760_09250 [Salinicoccus sp. ID82-1]|uniref:Uncharacterized protein n=1 Tax=Salinicoccus cyprini TaxID=2493691 RepID=A0A558AR66_9STAP|nr:MULTISPECIES: hypothetical protein [Salinicoccus]MCG1010207.1 hypothetical protein [Salinicoccus sp. ID82-1]TVT26740.1 hypothetical protein FO441_12075 [Salinicoccus cyprini]